MSTHDAIGASDQTAPFAGVHRFSVSQYHQMIATGVLGENDRVELLDGRIVDMTPIGSLHSVVVELTSRALSAAIGPQWHVRNQQPITLDDSEPEPDLIVARGAVTQYVQGHPSPSDIGLVVEVADASLDWDRTEKLRIYASAAMPVYWIINLSDSQIEIFRNPRPAGGSTPATYQSREVIALDGAVRLTLDESDIEIAVSSLIPQ